MNIEKFDLSSNHNFGCIRDLKVIYFVKQIHSSIYTSPFVPLPTHSPNNPLDSKMHLRIKLLFQKYHDQTKH